MGRRYHPVYITVNKLKDIKFPSSNKFPILRINSQTRRTDIIRNKKIRNLKI